MNDLDEKRSIWVREEMLGTVRTLRHRGEAIRYRLPKEIDGDITLRFAGRGKKENQRTGDFFLQVRVDRGLDIETTLWLAESEAAAGCEKRLLANGKRVAVAVPPASRDGQIASVAGAGKRTPYAWGLPLFGRTKGAVRAKFRLFQDKVSAVYGDVARMGDDDLATEGWVYRRIDLVMEKIGRHVLRTPPIQARTIANLYNEGGWRALAKMLKERLDFATRGVLVLSSPGLPHPGQCARSIQKYSSGTLHSCYYTITIRSEFLDDPFAVTAILAHEFCHAIYSRHLAPGEDYVSQPGAELLEEERTVDLLVFMFQLGEFQMRVARDRRLTLGYFNQPLFERMQVILARKRQAWEATTVNCRYCGRENPSTQSDCTGCGLSLG